MGNYKESIEIHQKSLEIRKNITQNDYIVESLNCLGLVYYLNNDFENSIKYLSKVNELNYQDKDQSYLNKLYLALIDKAQDKSLKENEIINYIENIENLNYEIYYFTYKICDDMNYLDLARDLIKQIPNFSKEKLEFCKYPIPSIILKDIY